MKLYTLASKGIGDPIVLACARLRRGARRSAFGEDRPEIGMPRLCGTGIAVWLEGQLDFV